MSHVMRNSRGSAMISRSCALVEAGDGRRALAHLLHQLRDFHAEQLADLIEAVERQVAGRQQTLHARQAELHVARDLRVGDVAFLQRSFDLGNDRELLGHGQSFPLGLGRCAESITGPLCLRF